MNDCIVTFIVSQLVHVQFMSLRLTIVSREAKKKQ